MNLFEIERDGKVILNNKIKSKKKAWIVSKIS